MHQDKVTVVSGDTTISSGVEQYSKDADILIHEASNTAVMNLRGDELDSDNSSISSERIKRAIGVYTDTLVLAKLKK